MPIYIAKNGQQFGPFNEDELRQYVTEGRFAASDSAWTEGRADWVPLDQIIGLVGAPRPPPVAGKTPGVGVASFVIGLVSIVLWIALLASAAVGVAQGYGSKSGMMIAIGLLLFLGLGVNIVAIVLGVIAVNRANVPKTLSIIGIVINTLEFLGVLSLMLIGMAAK